jgi:hypothetical protein
MTDDANSKKGKSPSDKAGKISHDARGNAVWQWGSGTIRQTLDSTSKMLKRLEIPGLALLDDPKPEDQPQVDAMEALKAKRETGFDPYEGQEKIPTPPPTAPIRPAARPGATATPPRPAPRPAAVPGAKVPPARPPEPPARKPSLLGRLFGKDRDH